MPALARRLEFFPDSAIGAMTRLIHQTGAINLAQGFPDFAPPTELIEAAHHALDNGHHQYSVTHGSSSFRKALAEKQSLFMGIEIDPQAHLTVTAGGTEAMLAALATVLDPGDRVIIFSPFYENYAPDAILCGAQPVYVPLHLPDFRFDPEELRHAFKSGAKACILCNPSNPTGKVFTPQELQTILDLAQEYDAFLVTDEVYEHIIYAPHRHTYLASLPGAFERTISCSSLSKTYHITGWRLGYVIAPPEITHSLRKVHDFLLVCVATPLQEAAVTALRFPLSYYSWLQEEYTRKRGIFLDYLSQAGLRYFNPQGAFFVLIDISDFGFRDDFDFCSWLAREIGVAGVPGSSFFSPPLRQFMRLSFCKSDSTLVLAGQRLMRLQEKV